MAITAAESKIKLSDQLREELTEEFLAKQLTLSESTHRWAVSKGTSSLTANLSEGSVRLHVRMSSTQKRQVYKYPHDEPKSKEELKKIWERVFENMDRYEVVSNRGALAVLIEEHRELFEGAQERAKKIYRAQGFERPVHYYFDLDTETFKTGYSGFRPLVFIKLSRAGSNKHWHVEVNGVGVVEKLGFLSEKVNLVDAMTQALRNSSLEGAKQ